MNKLIELCMNAVSEIYHTIVILGADTKKRDTREILFKKLVALHYGVSSMILHLGYSEKDLYKALKQMQSDSTKK